jgi:hypothetical protein
MTEFYFGTKWDAPAFDDAVEVCCLPNQNCLLCQEPIEPGDSGILMRYSGPEGFSLEPEHIECHLRSVLGSVDHLKHAQVGGVCNGNNHPEPSGSYRDQAREVMDMLVYQKEFRGL